jgi:hypothetical protein
MASSLPDVFLTGPPAKPESVCVEINTEFDKDRLGLSELMRQMDEATTKVVLHGKYCIT